MKTQAPKSILLAAVLAFFATPALSAVFVLGPDAMDAYIDSRFRPDLNPPDLANQNYGSAERLSIGHNDLHNDNINDGLIQFDVSALPSTGVLSAAVVLTIEPVPEGAGTPTTVSVHRITSPWDEATVTWNTRPTFDPLPAATAVVSNLLGEAFRWDITSLYLDWRSGTVPNYGLYFTASTNNGEGFGFVSSDNTTWPALRPALHLALDGETSIRISQVEVCWASATNRLYLVQYKSELTTNAWLNLRGPIQTTGPKTCITDGVSVGEPRRIYRVVPLP